MVENICADRVFVLIVKDVILGSTITGKTVDEHEYRELNLVHARSDGVGGVLVLCIGHIAQARTFPAQMVALGKDEL